MDHLAQICTGLVVISRHCGIRTKSRLGTMQERTKKSRLRRSGAHESKADTGTYLDLRILDRMCPGLIWPKQTQSKDWIRKLKTRAHVGKAQSEPGLDKKTGNQGSRGKSTLRGILG
jgi:hypothetical protein